MCGKRKHTTLAGFLTIAFTIVITVKVYLLLHVITRCIICNARVLAEMIYKTALRTVKCWSVAYITAELLSCTLYSAFGVFFTFFLRWKVMLLSVWVVCAVIIKLLINQ